MKLDDDLKYFGKPEFQEILTQYESAMAAGSPLYMDADDLTDVAEYYAMVCNDNERANEAIELALKLHPDAVSPQVFKARQIMQDGDIDGAFHLCDAIDDQQDREVNFLRAELLIKSDKPDEAVTLLKEMREQLEEDVDFFLYDSAYIFVDYNLYEQALQFADPLEVMAPDWYKTWQVKADILLGMERFRDALAYLQRMLDVDPFATETWNWSAEAYSGLGQFNESLSSTEYALAIDPDNERALQLKAWVLQEQQNLEEAHNIYERLHQMAPDCLSHWLYDAYALSDLERYDEAAVAIDRAEALAEQTGTDLGIVYEHQTMVHSCRGDVEGALRYLELAKEVGNPPRAADDYILQRVRVYLENDRLEEAQDSVVEALDVADDIDKPVDLYLAAQMVFENGYYNEAIAMFTDLLKVASKDPNAPKIHAFLAYSYMQIGEDENALHHLKIAQDGEAENLLELFCADFPNVQAAELYDYYYYRVFGRWPL